MALTFLQLKTMMGDEIGDSDSQDTANYGRYLNLVAEQVWTYAAWRQRKARGWVNTVAAYETGTITTDGTTGVTGGSTAWSTAGIDSPMKLALGYSKPWQRIASVGGETSLTTAEAVAWDDVTASSYVIYSDIVALPSDLQTLTRVRLHDTSRSYDVPLTHDHQMTGAGSFPVSSGRPRWASIDQDISGVPQMKVGPYAPDQVYRLELEYLKTYTAMSADGDNTGLDGCLDDVILVGALAHAYRRDHFQRSRVMEREFRQRLRKEWAKLGVVSPMITQIAERGPRDNGGPDSWPIDLNSAEIT